MKLRGSHLVSLAILAAVGGWMATGELILGGQADPDAKTIVEREAERETQVFRVRVQELQPSQRPRLLSIRGRTQANAMVSVRAETGGTILTREVEKGQRVEPGQLLCTIDEGVRGTNLAQAEALLEQAKADYEANQNLAKKGFTTQSRLRSLKAAYDSAKASVASAKQDMKRTEIRATVAGQVQEPFAEPGDNLSPGGVCLTLMDTDPMLFSGQVPEREVSNVQPGMSSLIKLVSGEEVTGKVRYISPIADANTRTFTVEIELPNSNMVVRDGITATAAISLPSVTAYRVDPSWVTLADNGEVGVRVVDASKKVSFVPLTILAQDQDVLWVTGLTPGSRVITLGQNFVAGGQFVEPVSPEQMQQIIKARENEETPAPQGDDATGVSS